MQNIYKKLLILIIAILLGLVIAFFNHKQLEAPLGRVSIKEFNIAGEKILLGGEQLLGGVGELADFKPEAKLEKWGDETYLKIWSEETGDKTASQIGDKVVWNAKDGNEYNFYTKTAAELGSEDGGFEYEIILKEKPKTNIVSLKIETKDLDFFYQPELTQYEEEGDSIRPDNIIGSYAVYHKTKKDHISGQTNYKAGKAFHIYRPQIIDANGNKIWGEFNKDVQETGTLSITIDQKWLDKAAYPVTVDPTIGYTTVGATQTSSLAVNTIRTWSNTLTATGTIISISYYTRAQNSSYDNYFRGVVYNETTMGRIDYGSQVTLTNYSTFYWYSNTFTSEVLIGSGTPLRIGVWVAVETGGSNGPMVAYDAGATMYRDNYTYHSTNAPVATLVDDASTANFKASIYATYMPGDHEKITLAAGENYVHGSVYVKDKLFLTTRTSPAKILKFNTPATDLSDYDVYTWANDGRHVNADSLVYSTTQDKLYILFSTSTRITVAALDPDDPVASTTDVIAYVTSGGSGGSAPITTDETYLYVVSNAATCKVYQFALSDYSLASSTKLAINSGHTAVYDGTNLYATGIPITWGWVAKIPPTNLAAYTQTYFPEIYEYPTDELAYTDDYLWIGFEDEPNVFKVAKSNFATTSIGISPTFRTYSMAKDDTYIWTASNIEAKIYSINIATNATTSFDLTPSATTTNELIFNDDCSVLYTTGWTAPATVRRFINFQGTTCEAIVEEETPITPSRSEYWAE